MTATTRIVVADDHQLVRVGLVKLIESLPATTVVAQASNGLELVQQALALAPDLVIVDVDMPRCNGIDATRKMLQQQPQLRVLILSMYDNEEYLRHALAAGARGYLLKDAAPTELEAAIAQVLGGGIYLGAALARQVVGAYIGDNGTGTPVPAQLSPRQREVLALIAQGHSNKAIARLLDISVKTAETHRMRLMQQLNIHDVAGLVRYAVREGVISAH
jgi:DNA-binding NarL/FixJ family response regulator